MIEVEYYYEKTLRFMLVQNESRARIEQNVLSHATKRTFARDETYFRALRNVLSSAASLSVSYNGKIVRLCRPLILCRKRKNFTPSLADLSNIFWCAAHRMFFRISGRAASRHFDISICRYVVMSIFRDYMIRLVPLHAG